MKNSITCGDPLRSGVVCSSTMDGSRLPLSKCSDTSLPALDEHNPLGNSTSHFERSAGDIKMEVFVMLHGMG